ncbi:Sortase family protein [Collinsella aerofaciens]|nr:Sortase family protein [Collinsella aerofaciens]
MASHFDAEHSSKKRLNIAAVGWVVLFAGALLLLVPDFVELSYGLRANSEMAAASKAIDAASDSNAVSESAAGEEALETADRGVSSRPWLESYNERVRQGGGMVINDPFTFGAADQSFAKTGLAGLPVGVLTVDSMACEAPVYLGSSEQNMLNGAAVVAGTSAPLGEPSSNCVIAAHRNMFFKQIENVRVGDRVCLRTIWGGYVYRVVEIRIISPSDIKSAAVQEGKDLLTLVTCHPYGSNRQRIIAVCERDEGSVVLTGSKVESLPRKTAEQAMGRSALSNILATIERGGAIDELFIEDCGRLLGRALLVFLLVRFIAAAVKRRKAAC